MNDLGKYLVIAGLALVVAGGLLWSGLGRGWLGQLPGDLRITRGNFSLHVPLMTCLLVSVLLTVILWLFRK